MTFNGVGAISVAELPNFWNYFFRLDWRPPVFDAGLTRGGPVARVVSGGGVQVEINSDRRKSYTYGVFSSYSWNHAGGRGLTISPRAALRPSTALRITFSPSFSRTHAMAQFVTRITDPLATDTYGSRYVFATLNQRQLALVTRVDWTFTPALSLQLFAQPLLAAADFHDYKEFARPRQFDFEVYGRDIGTITRSESRYLLGRSRCSRAGAVVQLRRPRFQSPLTAWQCRTSVGIPSGLGVVLRVAAEPFRPVPSGEFDFSRDFEELWKVQPENVFVVKATLVDRQVDLRNQD